MAEAHLLGALPPHFCRSPSLSPHVALACAWHSCSSSGFLSRARTRAGTRSLSDRMAFRSGSSQAGKVIRSARLGAALMLFARLSRPLPPNYSVKWTSATGRGNLTTHCGSGHLPQALGTTVNNSLTTIEQNYIEHWSRRRAQLFRTSVISGALLWGGLMSAFALWSDYADGKLTSSRAMLFVSLLLVGGCFFGAAMWAVGEFRFRRLRAKASRSGA